jgi:LysM repeat protein
VSSLRPLATILLLAAVGVFLYMKINESEPKLSPELETWSTTDLEIGGGALADKPAVDAIAAASPSGVVPVAPLGAGGQAPPFVATPSNPAASAAPYRPAGDAAPPWSPESPAAAAGDDSSPMARSAAPTPPLPTIPPLPIAPGDGTDPASPRGDAARDPLAATAPPAEPDAPSAPGWDSAATATGGAEPTAKPSMFAAARVAAQGALDRGELAQALSILSEWYGDPSLTPEETKDVDSLLSQLAGSVIYEGPPAHRLAAPHIVQTGETLPSIAEKYQVPWQLLAKINGIADPHALTPGQELKVIPGPFSATIDLSERKMTLKLDRRYAGRFTLEIDPAANIPEGEWRVEQKLLTPAMGGVYGVPGGATEDRSLLLANVANPAGPPAILRGPGNADPVSATPRERTLRLKSNDVADVYDILSEGSRVTITR